MKKITALDWISNNIKSEDLYENRTSLGLNKHVQKKFNDADAVDNLSLEYVDLGLPSGTLWCRHNYGVVSEEEYGEFYTFDEAQKLDIKLPTREDFIELDKHCDHKWDEVNGVHGMLFTSKFNGESVFFPAADHGIIGNFWTSSSYSATGGYTMWFCCSVVHPGDYDNRIYSFSVRAVK